MSWSGFFSPPQAYCSSGLPPRDLPNPLLPYVLRSSSPSASSALRIPRLVLCFLKELRLYSHSAGEFKPLQELLVFGQCGPHLASRCEKCMKLCMVALRLDIDSITHGSVPGCLNTQAYADGGGRASPQHGDALCCPPSTLNQPPLG